MGNLEELLLKMNEVKTLTEAQNDEALRTVLQTEVKSFVQESLTKKDVALITEDNLDDYDEEVVGSPLDVDGVNDMGDSGSVEDTGGDVDDTVVNTDMSTDLDTPSMDATDTTDDDVLDLTNATTEEVLAALQHLPDDTVIEIRKNAPSFSVTTSGGSEDVQESATNDGDNDSDDNLDEEIEKWVDESLQESANAKLVEEYKIMLEQYEGKMQKMQTDHANEIKSINEQLNNKSKEVETLTEQHNKYNDALNQSQTLLESLAVHNTNLLHITKLFTEQTVSKEEKTKIAKQFDSVKTINESKILYEALSQTLPKKQSSNDFSSLKEEMAEKQTIVKTEIIKEEKTFNDPNFVRFQKLIEHKI